MCPFPRTLPDRRFNNWIVQFRKVIYHKCLHMEIRTSEASNSKAIRAIANEFFYNSKYKNNMLNFNMWLGKNAITVSFYTNSNII